MIEIKNYSKYSGHGEYIGRYNYYYGLKASPLSNPYAGRGDYESKLNQVKKFKKYLQSLPENSSQWKEIRRLQNIYKNKLKLTLLCWCDPLPCHGEVIKSAILGDIRPKNIDKKLIKK